MDAETDLFYDAYAEQLRQRPEAARSAMMALAERFFREGDVILDVGAGSGRDTAALRALGMAAVGVEPNDAMRARAIAAHPELAGHLRSGGLPALGQPFADRYPDGFDGVVCSAVVMHIEPAALGNAMEALACVLRPGGSQERGHGATGPSAVRETTAVRETAAVPSGPAPPTVSTIATQHLLLSVPEMSHDRLLDNRDPDGRLFFNHAPQRLIDLLEPHGLTLCAHEVSDAVLAASGTRWHSLAFARQR